MVFSTSNLFKDIQCPEGERCVLTNCIFAHDLRPQKSKSDDAFSSDTSLAANLQDHDSIAEPAPKRRKVTYEHVSEKPPSRADQIRSELAAVRDASARSSKERALPSTDLPDADNSRTHSLASLSKPVSPPPTNGRATSRAPQAGANNTRNHNNNLNNSNDGVSPSTALKQEAAPEEHLNPRLIANDPAGHAKRSLYLKHLHGEMVRLNRNVSGSEDLEHKYLFTLSQRDLIRRALNEEEKVAKDQPMVYANIIKQKISTYRKMTVEDWVKVIKTSLEKDKPKSTNKPAKPIETGLTPWEELLILPHLVADQTGLEKYGYIPIPPTEVQAAEAAAAVEASKNYEVCDRCSARFQVFPERNSDGLLTSNGPCKHHPNRKTFPQKSKGDVVSGLPKEPYYPCCNRVVGSPGCTDNEFHVFKSSTPARLAAVLPFVMTPENDMPSREKHGRVVNAVTFDCEMGYTVYGLELIRLTAVTWPSGEELLDVLVRPLGIVIDFNSRFSGVWPEHFTNALPYKQWLASQSSSPASDGTNHPATTSPLPIVESPQKARELLCTYLTPSTPLIGHAIDNDLNVVRLCHPTIIDTVLLFPHPRGLPMRYGLKWLTSKHLDRAIQTGGDRGHDSLEDAQATGDLVRFKIGEKWKLLKVTDWRIIDGELVPPPPLRREVGDGFADGGKDHVKAMVAKAFDGQAAGKKRRKKRGGNGGDESTEDEELPLGNEVAAYLERARCAGEEDAKNL